MKAFILAEHQDAARELCAGARSMADEVACVSIGGLELPLGVADKVLHITLPEGAVFDDAADTVVAALDASGDRIVLVEPTRRMKVIAGKLAAHFEASVITNVLSFDGAVATSLYFGGVGIQAQNPCGDISFYTVGQGVFADAEASGSNEIEDVAWIEPQAPLKLVSVHSIEKTGADLSKSDVIVAAGRGFCEESDLDMARTLCDKIGGALGCTRPLTEGLDWLPKETYIGVSGLMLSPKVYVAAGVSGQMQHMVGCNRAGTLFAINKDKNAPVFKQCDFGLVGDIKDVLPALAAAL